VEADASPPGRERVDAVVGDDHQPRAKAELGGQLAGTGPAADHLAPLARRVVAKALAESLGGAACEGWVGVRLDLELERRAGRREFEQLLEQQRALVAWSAVSVAEPARPDLRRGRRVGAVGAAEAVGVERRGHRRNCRAERAPGGYASATIGWRGC
jgi:hypothetical protein